ncbi:MAG TPA: TonB-dependent receptor, partial [Steroidobacteraceae bacterium]|nr:TonB-dependent receptor [Steroidobacteraceae bacterium]
TSQTIRLNGDQLLGSGSANTYNDQDDYYLASNLDWRFVDDWHLTGLNVISGEASYVGNSGLLCTSCADLALNGTTNSAGNPTASSIPGTSTIVSDLPLTGANALDVWDPAGPGNGTSAAVLAELADNATDSRWYYNMNQTRIGVEGSAFELPGGKVRLAAGGEFVHYGLRMDKTYPNNAGPSSLGSQTFELDLDRNVLSGYAEAMVPIIGPHNSLPMVRSLQVDLSGRFDNYMGLAKTSNPHFGLNWETVPGLTLKANYSTSFVAPQLTSVGDVSRGGLTSFSGYAVSNQGLVVPLASFPLAASVPGASCNAQTCTIPASVNGISVNGGPAHPQPGSGKSWSVGLQFTPSFIPHFSGDVTLFNTDLLNQISGNSASNAINSAALNSDLQFCPGGCSAAQLAAFVPAGWPQQSAIPSTVYYMLSVRQQNLLNLYTQGIDTDLHYAIPTATLGTVRLGVDLTQFLRFDQSIKGGPKFSVLNTTGFNNTFPSIETQGRADLGWDFRAISADLFLDYVGAYRNWSSTSVSPVLEKNGVPVGGGDHVAATELIDLHVSYDFDLLGGAQVFVDVTNLFNRDPVFYNSTNGYDPYTGDVLGRVSTLGIRVKLK